MKTVVFGFTKDITFRPSFKFICKPYIDKVNNLSDKVWEQFPFVVDDYDDDYDDYYGEDKSIPLEEKIKGNRPISSCINLTQNLLFKAFINLDLIFRQNLFPKLVMAQSNARFRIENIY